jgi:putative PIN family toxin of toxin-antitoxin system
MRVVLDTNSIVSGLLWRGAPRFVLDLARAGKLELFTSPTLLAELYEVLSRPKFAARRAAAGTTAHELATGYGALAAPIRAQPASGAVPDDPDDDHVVGCAIAAAASWIISGDSHLLRIGDYQGVQIGSAREFVQANPVYVESSDE